MDATATAVRHLYQRRQQLRYRGCFSGAGPAGDHRDPPGQRHRCRHLLPVDPLHWREKPVEDLTQLGFVNAQRLVNLTKETRYGQLVAPHTVQVEALSGQHHRCRGMSVADGVGSL